jgi:hypothetical protein
MTTRDKSSSSDSVETRLTALIAKWREGAEVAVRNASNRNVPLLDQRQCFGVAQAFRQAADELEALAPLTTLKSEKWQPPLSECWKASNDELYEPVRCDGDPQIDWSRIHPAIRGLKILWWDTMGVRETFVHRPPAAPLTTPNLEPRCDCGAKLTMCVSCAVGEYQGTHPDCNECCAAPSSEPVKETK